MQRHTDLFRPQAARMKLSTKNDSLRYVTVQTIITSRHLLLLFRPSSDKNQAILYTIKRPFRRVGGWPKVGLKWGFELGLHYMDK